MSTIFIADTAYPELISKLKPRGTVIPIPSIKGLYQGIRNHPDLLVHPISDHLLIAREIEPMIRHILTGNSIVYEVIDEYLGTKYPSTVPLNAVSTDSFMIHNLKHTSKRLLSVASKYGLTQIHVGQGYTRCTTLPLSSSCFITCDQGVYKALSQTGLSVTCIENGDVRLDGHPHGFLPGCCGVVGNTLYTNGDIRQHTSYDTILTLCNKTGLTLEYIPDKPLVDIGSILHLKGEHQ